MECLGGYVEYYMAPFAVWAEPAWSPCGGWVNKLLHGVYRISEGVRRILDGVY